MRVYNCKGLFSMDSNDKKIRLTFYGGAHEVGGNKVLLEDFGYDVKIFMDFGINIKNFWQRLKRSKFSRIKSKKKDQNRFIAFDENSVSLSISITDEKTPL